MRTSPRSCTKRRSSSGTSPRARPASMGSRMRRTRGSRRRSARLSRWVSWRWMRISLAASTCAGSQGLGRDRVPAVSTICRARALTSQGWPLGPVEGPVHGLGREELAGVGGVLLVELGHLVAGEVAQGERLDLDVEGTGGAQGVAAARRHLVVAHVAQADEAPATTGKCEDGRYSRRAAGAARRPARRPRSASISSRKTTSGFGEASAQAAERRADAAAWRRIEKGGRKHSRRAAVPRTARSPAVEHGGLGGTNVLGERGAHFHGDEHGDVLPLRR